MSFNDIIFQAPRASASGEAQPKRTLETATASLDKRVAEGTLWSRRLKKQEREKARAKGGPERTPTGWLDLRGVPSFQAADVAALHEHLLSTQQLEHLERLYVPCDVLGDDGGEQLAILAGDCPRLQFLKADRAGLVALDPPGRRAAKMLARAVRTCQQLQRLSLVQWQVPWDGVRVLVQALAAHPSLTSLNLRDIRINGRGLTHVMELLERTVTLRKLNLRQNQELQGTTDRLGAALRDNVSLEVLYADEQLQVDKVLKEKMLWNLTLQSVCADFKKPLSDWKKLLAPNQAYFKARNDLFAKKMDLARFLIADLAAQHETKKPCAGTLLLLGNHPEFFASNPRAPRLPLVLRSTPPAPNHLELQTVVLTACGLSGLPSELLQLPRLRRLVLAHNSFTQLPPTVGGLTALEQLDLSGNQLATPAALPTELADCGRLVSLFAPANGMAVVPPVLARMTALTMLDLSANQLTTLPDELCELPSLSKLHLADNALVTLPPAISRLTQLEELWLYRNRLDFLPAELARLLKLAASERLGIDGNRLMAIPPSVLSSAREVLRYLEELEKGSQQYTKLKLMFVGQGGIGKTSLLACFHEDQKATAAPAPAAPTPAPTVLPVGTGDEGDPGAMPRGTITSAALRRQQSRPGTLTMSSSNSRLSVLPLSGLGGTMSPMTARQMSGALQRTQTQTAMANIRARQLGNATDGIDIREWRCQDPKDKSGRPPIVFRSWDFGGQEVYYTTHQFFLSKARAVYLVLFKLPVVLNPELANKVDPGNPTTAGWAAVEYWLGTLDARASGSPVLLVGTHVDDPSVTKAGLESVRTRVADLKKRYRNVDSFFPVNANFKDKDKADRTGQVELKARLVDLAWEKKLVGYQVPNSYVLLAQQLERMALTGWQSVMPWNDFRALALDFNIAERNVVDAARFLSETGDVVYFPEEHLVPFVFLDPQWLSDLMSSVYSFKNNHAREGRITRAALCQLWKEPDYPAHMHPIIVRLLTTFEMLYPLPPSEDANAAVTKRTSTPTSTAAAAALAGQGSPDDQFLIAAFLPAERPRLHVYWPECEPSALIYSREYRLRFVPTGLFPRLMVRLLHWGRPRIYWRNGLVLVRHSETALVELVVEEQLVRLTVRGPHAARLLRIIVETLDALVTNWYQLQVERMVPCSHCLRDTTRFAQPSLFRFDDCQMALTEGRQSVTCAGSPPREVPLADLLPDVVMHDVSGVVIDYARDLHLEKPLGKGAFGIIYRARWRDEQVAVKVLMLDKGVSPEEKARAYGTFRQEVWVMSGLAHPNVTSLKGYCVDPYAMVMDFVRCGDLYAFLHDMSRPLDWPLRLRLGLDIATGMAFLHALTPPLLHRDLKSPNILLDSLDPRAPVCAKVSDFGLSSLLFLSSFKERVADRAVANPTWLAPEVLNEEEYSERSDVYALGVMLHELLTREHPFEHFKFKYMWQLEDLIRDGKRPAIPADCPPVYRGLVEAAWAPRANARPSFAEIASRLKSMAASLCLPDFELLDSPTIIARNPECMVRPPLPPLPAADPTPAAPPAPLPATVSAALPTNSTVSSATSGPSSLAINSTVTSVSSATATNVTDSVLKDSPAAGQPKGVWEVRRNSGDTATGPVRPSPSRRGLLPLLNRGSGSPDEKDKRDKKEKKEKADKKEKKDKADKKDKKPKKEQRKSETIPQAPHTPEPTPVTSSPSLPPPAEKPPQPAAAPEPAHVPTAVPPAVATHVAAVQSPAPDATASKTPLVATARQEAPVAVPPTSPSPAPSVPTSALAATPTAGPANTPSSKADEREAALRIVPTSGFVADDTDSGVLGGRAVFAERLEPPVPLHSMALVAAAPPARLLPSLLLGAADGSLHVLDAQTGAVRLSHPRVHHGPISGMALVGDQLWTASHDKTIKLWPVPELLAQPTANTPALPPERSEALEMLHGEAKWRPRHAVLSGFRLALYAKASDRTVAEDLLMVDVLGVGVREDAPASALQGKKGALDKDREKELAKRPAVWYVTTRQGTFFLTAPSPAARAEWIAAVAARRQEKRRAARTIGCSDRVSCLLLDQHYSPPLLWAAAGLVLTLHDARSGDTRAERKLELALLDAGTSVVSAMIRPSAQAPHVWLAVGRRLLRVRADSGAAVDQLSGHTDQVTALSTVGSEVWSAARDGSVRAWDASSGAPLRSLRPFANSVASLLLPAGDDRVWAFGEDGRVAVLARDLLRSLGGGASEHIEAVSAAVVVPSLHLVWSAGLDGRYVMWT